MKEGTYICSHDWWDAEDNWYLFEGTWYYEPNYPEMPDNITLQSIELIDQDKGSPDISNLLDKNGDVWDAIAYDGITGDARYEDYRDYDKDDL